MKKMVIFRNLPQYERSIKRAAPGWEIVFVENRESDTDKIKGAEILLGWPKEIKKALEIENESIRWIQSYSAGVDDLPLEMIKQNDILLTTTSGVHARPISESVFAMMLGLARNIPQTLNFQQQSKWSTKGLGFKSMQEIHGKTIGILGTGAVGEEIARISRAFVMRTLGYRKNRKSTPYIDSLYTGDELHDMLSECDYVVNVLPLTENTKNIIDKKAFDAMKPGARYFAFGRGETTDTDALIAALNSGQLAGAGLDVVHPEPLPKESPLWNMENVMISPHVSGHSTYYDQRGFAIFIENLKAYIETGEPIKNVVNLEQAY